MRLGIIIYTLTIFEACLLVEISSGKDKISIVEARLRAEAAKLSFISGYSSLSVSHFQNTLQKNNEDANEQIRLPYDEFYTNITMTHEIEKDFDCYYITSLHLNIDVTRILDYSYQIPTSYNRVVTDMETRLYKRISDDYDNLLNKLSASIDVPNINDSDIESIITDFEIQTATLAVHAQKLLNAFEAELDKVMSKFNDETAQRVTNTIQKLQFTKENYAKCKGYRM